MSLDRNVIAALILLAISPGIKAQYVLTGRIVDTAQVGIPSATVIVSAGPHTAAIAYGIADGNGYYEVILATPVDSLLMKVSALGFDSISRFIKPQRHDAISNWFIMSPAVIHLKEVVVRTEIANITAVKDTVTVRADAYRDHLEKTAEDLLKKIPGIEVSKNGAISINGKQIDRILIEGEDLVNKNYTVLSKNVSAELVDKIQIIDHYSDQPLQKGLVDSDDKVLNITLKKSRKSKVFGNAIVASGNDGRYDITANLIGLLSGVKLFGFTNANSVGKDPVMDITEEPEQSSGADKVGSQRSMIPKMIRIIKPLPEELTKSYINFNVARLGLISGVVKLNTKITARASLYSTAGRNSFQETNDIRYWVTRPPILIRQQTGYHSVPRLQHASFTLTYKPTNTAQLDYRFNNSGDCNHGDARIQLSDSFLHTAGTDRSLMARHQLSYTKRVNAHRFFKVDATYDQHKQQQHLLFIRPVLPVTDQLYTTNSNTGTISFTSVVATTQTFFEINAGLSFQRQQILSVLDSLRPGHRRVLAADSFQNNLTRFLAGNFFAMSVTRQLVKGIKWKLRVQGNYDVGTVHILEPHLLNFQYQKLTINPEISFKWVRKNHSTAIGYSLNSRMPDLPDFLPGYILSDYRTVNRGVPIIQNTNSRIFFITHSYTDWPRQLIFFANYLHIIDRAPLITGYTFLENQDIIDRIALTSDKQTSLFSVGIDKFISSLSSSLKFNSSIANSRYPYFLNGTGIHHVNAITVHIQLSARTALKGLVNVNVGAALDYSRTSVFDIASAIRTKNANRIFESFLNITLKLSQTFLFESEAEQFYFPAISMGKHAYYFVNATVQYKPSSSRFAGSLIAKNLINYHSFLNTSFTGYSSQVRQYDLVPRYILLQISYRF